MQLVGFLCEILKLLQKAAHHLLSGDNTDKHVPVIDYRDEILIQGFCKDLADLHINLYGRIPVRADNAF